jgi:serine/threonine protein kinase
MNRAKEKKKRYDEYDSEFVNQYLNFTAPPRHIKPLKTPWKVGDLIDNRYEINEIKRGGMGIVYLCYDNKAGEDIAIKTYIEREEDYRETIERFRSEALTWIKLGKHRNIVQAKYVLNIKERPYIFMEYIHSVDDNSPSLKILLEKSRLDHEKCLNFAVQFCEGMIQAASIIPGMIHNDIKPENILVTRDGTLKISDFGLTKVFYNLSSLGIFNGTPSYASPEQCLGVAMTDLSSDIYSFGVVLYEMFTGNLPFEAENTKEDDQESELIRLHLLKIPEEPKNINPKIPDGLSDIIMKCLEKKPEDRYRNFKELKAALLLYYKPPFESNEIKVSKPNFKSIEAQRYVNKGISMTTFGRYHEALSLFDLALKINPDNIEALSRKGIALIGMGRYNEAYAYFNQYLKVNPCDADVLNHTGSILNLQGKREEAVEFFNKALDINSFNSEILYNKAVTLFTMGKYIEAEETLKKIKPDTIGDSSKILMETCLMQSNPDYSFTGTKLNTGSTKKNQ